MSDQTFSSSRSLRSNTDKSLDPLPPVLKKPIERKDNKQRTSFKAKESESPNQPESTDLNTETPESESPSPIQPESTNLQVEPKESSESSLSLSDSTSSSEFEDNDLFIPSLLSDSESDTVVNPDQFASGILHQSSFKEEQILVMADTKEDIVDDRATLSDRVIAINGTLSNHNDDPMSKQQIQFKIDDLKSIKVELDQLRKRTRKVYRGTGSQLNEALSLDTILFDDLEKATLLAHKIKNELESSVTSRVKIPKAEPPEFDGLSINWPSFLDQFQSVVVDNTSVSATDKLSLLKKSLEKGSAYPIIQNFPLTDINWENAWDAVKSRYSHERELAYAHLNKLFELTPINHATQSGIRHLIDTVNDVVRGLNHLKVNTEGWDLILIQFIRKNLDNRTRTDFEKSLQNDKIHSLETLITYLNNVATALGTATLVYRPQSSDNPRHPNSENKAPQKSQDKDNKSDKSDQSSGSSTNNGFQKHLCVFCKEKHRNSTCPTLVPLTPQQRSKLAKVKSLCLNCLKPSSSKHKSQTCNSNPCGLNGCELKHHRLLHFERANKTTALTAINNTNEGQGPGANTVESLSASNRSVNCLLATAVLHIVHNNKPYKVRAVIDQGSQVNLMTERFANQLKLKRKQSSLSVTGIGNSKCAFSNGRVTIQIQSKVNPAWMQFVDCHILPEVTKDKPSQELDSSILDQFLNLKLADETFFKPGPIDLLLGTQVFLDILGNHHVKGYPSALDTKLGYLIMGDVNVDSPQETATSLTCDVDFDLTRFWKQEEITLKSEFSPEDKEVEAQFEATHRRSDEGRYIVQFPFIPNHKPLGESRNQAVKRLFQLESKLKKYPEKSELYHDAMNAYITSGHLIKVQFKEINKPCNESFYLPHHFVEKESTSTPLRVVFDGSAKSNTGLSLNDILRVGPTLQRELIDILSKFREHRYVFMADLKKMYLQVQVHEPHQDYLRVLWRESPKDPIRDFKFTRVPFGTSSSAYLTIKTIQHLASQYKDQYPLGAEALKDDVYVDDCLSGGKEISEAFKSNKSST